MLNRCCIDCAVYGNHDFDFGVGTLIELKNRCNFPWLLSNVRDAASGDQLANGLTSLLIERGGIRIGLLGLVEEEWIATLATLEPDDIVFEDPVECANRLGPRLRARGADVVIALTHMRGPRDERLARLCGGGSIDLILGGHDHEYEVNRFPSAHGVGDPLGTWVIKSGTDFRDLSTVQVTIGPGGGAVAAINVAAPVRLSVTAGMPEDPEVAEIVAGFEAKLTADLDKPIGESAVVLDCRFGAIRTRETAIGNFVADCMRQGIRPVPDLTLINSGTLRADKVIRPGVITMLDLTALLPLLDPLVVIELTGEQLAEALENGVSQWPALEGRWPLTSGVRFAFDCTKPAGSRVNRGSVMVGGELLDPARTYTLLTKEYLATGKDGYTGFKDCPVRQDAEQNPMLSGLIRRYFLQHAVVNAWSRPTSPVEALVKRAADRLVLGINSPSRLLRRHSSQDNLECYAIAPQVDGRITQLESQRVV